MEIQRCQWNFLQKFCDCKFHPDQHIRWKNDYFYGINKKDINIKKVSSTYDTSQATTTV